MRVPFIRLLANLYILWQLLSAGSRSELLNTDAPLQNIPYHLQQLLRVGAEVDLDGGLVGVAFF